MTTALRTLAFGELEAAGPWGAAWSVDSEAAPLTALGAGGEWTAPSGLRLTAGSENGEWRLDGDAADLLVAPAGEPLAVQAQGGDLHGCDQLCRVTGRFARGGGWHAVDCVGLRTWWSGALDLERYESIRAVSSWFEPDEVLALTAFRPRKAKAHDRDLATGAVITGEGAAPVEDARLSTTYGPGGWPVRAGLELWLAAEEPERQYPRRAAGAATGVRAQASAGAFELRAEPFRWHSRGRDGAGMYVLARRR